MKNLLKALFGDLKIHRKIDYFFVPLKILYLFYTLPFLVFAFGLGVQSLGAIGSLNSEKVGIIKARLLHFSAIWLSFLLWGIILTSFNII